MGADQFDDSWFNPPPMGGPDPFLQGTSQHLAFGRSNVYGGIVNQNESLSASRLLFGFISRGFLRCLLPNISPTFLIHLINIFIFMWWWK